jgi:hypothetical protein
MARVDLEHRRITAGLQIVGCGIVVLHYQLHELFGLAGVFENRVRVLVAAPDQRQPLARHDQVRADEDACQETIELTDQHGVTVGG